MEKNKNLTIRAMSFDTDKLQIEVGNSGKLEENGILNGSITIKTKPATLEGGVLTCEGRKYNVSYDEKAFEEARQYRKVVVNSQGKTRSVREDTPTK